MNDLIRQVEQWAEDRGFFEECGPTALQQYKVLQEEVTELHTELVALDIDNRYDCDEADTLRKAKLELGDVFVVGIIIARLLDVDATECLQSAYNKIKDRKGEWRNGKWTKNSDKQ